MEVGREERPIKDSGYRSISRRKKKKQVF